MPVRFATPPEEILRSISPRTARQRRWAEINARGARQLDARTRSPKSTQSTEV